MYAQRMNVGLHQVTERIINHPVALQTAVARKRTGHNGHVIMPSAIGCAGVTDMQMTLVFDQ